MFEWPAFRRMAWRAYREAVNGPFQPSNYLPQFSARSSALAFNRIDGDIRLDGGLARSDNLMIDGPAAEIVIRGDTDLRSERFDQTVDVKPKSANVLTAVGAVAGGPIGAAVGAVANAVLKKPLAEMGAKTYRVTGPWKSPKVEVVGREQSRARTNERTGSAGAP